MFSKDFYNDIEVEDVGFAKKHLPETEEIFKFIEGLDFFKMGDYFCFKSGGDGDNGEVLMDELDAYFKYKKNSERKD